MMRDLSRCCLHTITTKPWPIETAVDRFARAGVTGITVWRDALAGRSIGQVGRRIRESGLKVVSLCRGGFFPSPEAGERAARIEDNRRAVDEAAELGAPHVVLVCGADPRQSLADSRAQIRDGIRTVLPCAESRGVRLAIEPLHPMYADARSAVNTLRQANDMVEEIGHPALGVAVDVYHLWWDPGLEGEIERCGRLGALLAFHVCDWKSPTLDFLNDRGLMGEGCIDIAGIRNWVERAGFTGFVEVEIFSTSYWSGDQDEFLAAIIEAYKKHV